LRPFISSSIGIQRRFPDVFADAENGFVLAEFCVVAARGTKHAGQLRRGAYASSSGILGNRPGHGSAKVLARLGAPLILTNARPPSRAEAAFFRLR
jgi:hypothetical protein